MNGIIYYKGKGYMGGEGSASGGSTTIKAKSLDSILSSMSEDEAETYLNNLKAQGITLNANSDGSVTVPVSNDLFIQNAIQYTERGGGADFSYETKTLDLPLIGGIRVFNEEVKSEIIAKGMVCINAIDLNSIDEEEVGSTPENRKFKNTSVFGVLEEKIKKLKGENETIEGIKIPWLYSTIATHMCTNDSNYRDSRLNYWLGADIDGTGNAATSSLVCSMSIQNTEIGQGHYVYRILGKNNNTNNNNFKNLIDNIYSVSCYMDSFDLDNFDFQWYRGAVFYDQGTFHCLSAGGYTKSNVFGADRSGLRDVCYSQQPFVIGMVNLITAIYPTEAPSCQSYLLPVALDINGKIIKPKNPVKYDNGNKIVANWDTAPSTCPFYREATNANNESVSDTCRGNVLALMYIPMTIEEKDYATSQDYVIAPTDWIPENYLDPHDP